MKLDDLEIVKTAQMEGAGVFDYDKWNGFSDKVVKLNSVSNIKTYYTEMLASNESAVRRLHTEILVNTLVFMNVWTYLQKQTTWMSLSWVMKMEKTTVFIHHLHRSRRHFQSECGTWCQGVCD